MGLGQRCCGGRGDLAHLLASPAERPDAHGMLTKTSRVLASAAITAKLPKRERTLAPIARHGFVICRDGIAEFANAYRQRADL